MRYNSKEMPADDREILRKARASLARMSDGLGAQRDELLRLGPEMCAGAELAGRVIDCARKISEIMSTLDQEGIQA